MIDKSYMLPETEWIVVTVKTFDTGLNKFKIQLKASSTKFYNITNKHTLKYSALLK